MSITLSLENKIDWQIGECPYGNLHKESTRAWLIALWEIVLASDDIETPDDIEILGINPTFKLVYKDRPSIKAILTMSLVWQYLCLLHEALLPVCTPLFCVRSSESDRASYWCFVSWVEGSCDRVNSLNANHIKSIPTNVWYSLGSLLACIHSIPTNNDLYYLTSIDIGWWNYVIDEQKNVWLIDPKKFQSDEFPERWIYFNIFFHKHITFEQKQAFIEGYASVELKERSQTGMEMLLAAKQFSDMLYEKLAN